MHTWHIHIEGQVQGVGFRPQVYRLARERGLTGWVNNSPDGLHIVFNAGTEEAARAFLEKVLKQAPALARISRYALAAAAPAVYHDFQIVHSHTAGIPNLLLTPDFALCPACRREVHEPQNRRYSYAFTTCTHCGPRYSIIHSLPYDRERTSMADFVMCAQCEEEYHHPLDRRYYAQTNSCPHCRIALSWVGEDGTCLQEEETDLLAQTLRYWQAGKIVAIKGIGGYLLTCDAAHADAIHRLRVRKQRPFKPFALMFPRLEEVKQVAEVPPEAEAALCGPVAPVVLLSAGPQAGQRLALQAIAPELNQIGVMLPYTPLYELLLSQYGKPIVATSANISHAPIVFEDAQARACLPAIADALLLNQRQIVLPQDDSVLKFSPAYRQQIVIRRSRGLAPTCMGIRLDLPESCLLATGAMMKSSFGFFHHGNLFVSQYLGDLEHFDTQEHYRHTLSHFLRLFHSRPERILCDAHPDYPSTHLARELAAEWDLPCEPVPHHQAHFAAVLAEHDLLQSPGPVLGVIWDGAGLGEDGQIWGGEFFVYETHAFRHCGQLMPFVQLAGDKMAREPRLSALAACHGLEAALPLLEEKFSPAEWRVYQRLLQRVGALRTSSMGRLFDAVAALLGIMDVQTYEGEAAMRLEALAQTYFRRHGLHAARAYALGPGQVGTISTPSLLNGVLADLKAGKSREWIAACFHFSLVKAVQHTARKLGITQIAFSGGVFQNAVLTDLLRHHLQAAFSLYFHRQLSPNDENIALGQLAYYRVRQLQLAEEQTPLAGKLQNNHF
ncbi:MAG: carbamoyltransferase HypF [Bacteroidetes bacterium]|nr:MAG: carbamoyltransferase HypF [Bacteroidota bacterium]